VGVTGPFGVHVADCSKGGATSTAFALGGTGQSSTSTDLSDWVTGIAPSLCLLALGVNDWSNGITPATYKANMQIIIDGLHDGDADLPIILIPWYEPAAAYHYTDGGDYTEYVQAQKELVAENSLVGICDIFLDDPTVTGASFRPAHVPGRLIDTASGFGLHPGDVGSASVADVLTRLFSTGSVGSLSEVA
jgi:lysophospholipase L1-like esterase